MDKTVGRHFVGFNEPRSEDETMYRISTFPKSWYLVGRSEDFTTDKPTSIELHKKKFVVYRKSDGSLAAVSSRCTHMGSNLAHGCIKNDHLVCPFHAWQYNSDG